ncbi:TPA: hypothetical protein ACH3X3_003901 [Trebouxia sp. C0006]
MQAGVPQPAVDPLPAMIKQLPAVSLPAVSQRRPHFLPQPRRQPQTKDEEKEFGQAAYEGNLSKVESYLASGGDPDMPKKQRPLWMAAWGNHPEVVEVLLKWGAS